MRLQGNSGKVSRPVVHVGHGIKNKTMQDFALLLKGHEENILTYFDMPISNGAVEGMNNKAKVISHRAYGSRSAKN